MILIVVELRGYTNMVISMVIHPKVGISQFEDRGYHGKLI